MKKNKMMRIASVLLVAVLLSTCAISGTFAKYTSTASGSATATVAKWSFKWNGGTEQEIAVSGTAPTLTFNLFSTINDTGNTADETDVADNKIAPGTAGSFTFTVSNTSEVTAKYTISLSEVNTNEVPLQYSVDGTTWYDSITEVVMTALQNQQLAIGNNASHTVHWKWGFEGGHTGQTDASDTALGVMGTAPTVTITASITAEQVD